MKPQRPSLETIEDFLAQKGIAMVGISRESRSFSATLFEELCRRGYDVVPVNPNIPNVIGRRCFARVQEIQPQVDAALLMTSPTVADTVVADCVEAGIHRVWMYRAMRIAPIPRAESCRKRGSASTKSARCEASPTSAC